MENKKKSETQDLMVEVRERLKEEADYDYEVAGLVIY